MLAAFVCIINKDFCDDAGRLLNRCLSRKRCKAHLELGLPRLEVFEHDIRHLREHLLKEVIRPKQGWLVELLDFHIDQCAVEVKSLLILD